MAYLGVTPTQEFSSVAKQSVTGDGSVSYTLNKGVSDANDLAVFVNDVRQEPGVAYTATGNTITFTANLESTDDCYILHIGRTFSSAESPGITDNATQKVLTITTDGHLVPTANVTYDLGTSDLRFRDIYLSGSSIELGDHSITANATHVAIGGLAFSNTISGDGSDLTTLNASELASGTIPDARFPATLPSANGTNLTSLNADELSSGTIPDARFPATLPSANGTNLTSLNATEITTGTIDNARLPSDINVANDLTIAGDLIVNGNTTTIAANELKVEDSLIQLASNNETSDTVDIGFVGHYYDGSTQVHTGFFRDASDEQYYLFKGYEDADFDTDTPPATIDRTANTFALADLNVGNLYVTNSTTSSFMQVSTNILQIGTSSADPVVLYSNNSERLRIDSAGLVGIGGITPAYSLHISEGATTDIVAQTTGANNTRAVMAVDNTAMYLGTAYSSTNVPLYFGAGWNGSDLASKFMTITAAGVVGIGTEGPERKLHVSTSNDYIAKFESTDGFGGIILEDSNSTTDGNVIAVTGDNMRFYTANALKAIITSAGNIGVGTDNPTTIGGDGGRILNLYNTSHASLSVQAVDGTNDRNATIEILSSGNGGSVSKLIYGDTDTTPGTASPLAIIQRSAGTSTERMRIDSDGKVGIGTDNPVGRFNVHGLSTEIVTAQVSNPDVALRLSAYTNQHAEIRVATNHDLLFKTNGNNERMRIDSDGNVGIGTTSTSGFGTGKAVRLGTSSDGFSLVLYSAENGNSGLLQFVDLNGANAFQIGGGSNAITLYGYGSRPMDFYTNGSSKLTINHTGEIYQNNTPAGEIVFSAGHTSFAGRQAAFPGRFVIGPPGNSYPDIGYNFKNSQTSAQTYIAGDTAWKISIGAGSEINFYDAAVGTAGNTISWRSPIMTLQGGGENQVGINQGTPAARLHVNGDGDWTFILQNSGTGGSTWYIGSTNDNYSSGGGRYVITNTGTSATSQFCIDGEGHVLLGTNNDVYGTTTRKELQVFGSSEAILTLDTAGASPIYINNNAGLMDIYNINNNDIRIGTNNAEKMRIKNNGIVEIKANTGSQQNAWLNIGSTGSGVTRAIDIDGSWSANESKVIGFTYGSGDVAAISAEYLSPGSRLQFGKFYHGAAGANYSMWLESLDLTNSKLTVQGEFELSGENFTIDHSNGGFYKNLGTVMGSSSNGRYIHVKTNAVWGEQSMTMFRITGYFPYSAYAEGYLGGYLYGVSSYRSAPYGPIYANQGNHAVAHSMYYSQGSGAELILVLDWNTNYNGLMIEHIGAGSSYGNNMRNDLEIVAYTWSSATTGVY